MLKFQSEDSEVGDRWLALAQDFFSEVCFGISDVGNLFSRTVSFLDVKFDGILSCDLTDLEFCQGPQSEKGEGCTFSSLS